MKYQFDTRLKLSNPKFGRILNRKKCNLDAANETVFPEDSILTKMANQAYYDKDYSLPEHWELLTNACNTDTANGYFGVAFWNPALCQVVVAHRGYSNFGGFITCLKLYCNSPCIEQPQSAATFVYLISQQIKKQNFDEGPRFQLTITGHSLGGWLAQITAVTVKYSKIENGEFVKDEEYVKNLHAHTVTIDNPGCKKQLDTLLESLDLKYKAYENLDITVCLAEPNFVNTIQEHVGRIYSFPLNGHAIMGFIYHFNPLDCIGITRDSMSKSITSKSLACSSAGYSPFKFRTLKGIPLHNSLNAFNEPELCFIKAWVGTAVNYPSIAEKYGSKFSIPDFKVDYVNKILKGNNLEKTIACIKRIPSIETVTQDMLDECAQQALLRSDGRSEATGVNISTGRKMFNVMKNLCHGFKVSLRQKFYNN